MEELKSRLEMGKDEIAALYRQRDIVTEQARNMNRAENWDLADSFMALADYYQDVIDELIYEACEIDAEIRRLETEAALEQIKAYTDAVLQQLAAL